MDLNQEQIAEIEQLAALFFTPKEILIVMGIFIQEISGAQIADPNFSLAFQRGKLKSEAEVRKSIIELAKKGSAPAQILADKIITQAKLNDIDV